ncbi:hypothetical protein BRCH_00659c [Candidatus Burkholderia brachyanthoides]|nr:hypothetical protein BRCH_00659c [Candidatus Burkholderia brachyanthoides]
MLSEAPNDGPIKYTVKMESKTFGNEQETRTIRSGQTDDFTWQGSAPSGAQAVADACPDSASVPKSADGAASVQISFRAYAPKRMNKVSVNGRSLQCPTDNRLSQRSCASPWRRPPGRKRPSRSTTARN